MLVLGLETSCDDTAAAVLAGDGNILANLVSSQDRVHRPFGGIVPELASRQHIGHILPIIDRTLETARVSLREVDGIAVTYGPGLVGSLLVGLCVAKGISLRWGIPYVGVNHLEGHLLSVFLERPVPFPYIALLVSGGHTLLYLVRDFGEYAYLGGTRDDAAGEAYDKVAKMMGLGYPGGKVIDQLARDGNPEAIRFPRARMKRGSYDFSFSGVKTAVWQYLQKNPEKIALAGEKADVAASFQNAVVDMLVTPTIRAAREYRVERIVVAGGVAANSRLRELMKRKASLEGMEAYFPAPVFCTDNAAMIALAGRICLQRGRRDDFRLNVDADLTL